MDSQLDLALNLANDQLANPRVAILYQGNRPKRNSNRNFSFISAGQPLFSLSTKFWRDYATYSKN